MIEGCGLAHAVRHNHDGCRHFEDNATRSIVANNRQLTHTFVVKKKRCIQSVKVRFNFSRSDRDCRNEARVDNHLAAPITLAHSLDPFADQPDNNHRKAETDHHSCN